MPAKRDSLKQCIEVTFSNTQNVNQEESKEEENNSVELAPMI